MDQMVNYIRLAWNLALMLRPYRTCNPTVEFQNMNSIISYWMI